MLEGSPFVSARFWSNSLKRIGQGQECTDRNGGHYHRNCHVFQNLSGGRTVNLCSLDQISRDILNSGNVNDHHIADLLPAHQDNQSPEAVGGGIGQCPVKCTAVHHLTEAARYNPG